MANNNIWCVTISVRHSFGAVKWPPKGCMPQNLPPVFRANGLGRPEDFSYKITPSSLERVQYLIRLGAIVQSNAKLYSNRMVLFFDKGPSYMEGKIVDEPGLECD